MGERLIIRVEDGTYAVPVDDLEQYRIDDEDETVGFAFGATPAQMPGPESWANPDSWAQIKRPELEGGRLGQASDGPMRIGHVAIIGHNG